MRAVYPEYTELVLASNNEKTILTDATEVIRELRTEVASLSLQVKRLINVTTALHAECAARSEWIQR